MKKKIQTFVSMSNTIAEMSTTPEGFSIEVPISESINVKELTKGDKDPLFVTLEALNSQVSKNGRFYSDEVISRISEQINTKLPEAYMGHLKAEDHATKNPEVQTIWLGSAIKDVGGKKRLFIKGYVLPYAKKLKSYLRAAKASGKSVAVSIYGQGREIFNKILNAFEVRDLVLESIDWARAGSAGIATLGILNLTAEMSQQDQDKVIDFWSGLTLSEIEKNRPELIAEMSDEIKNDLEVIIKDKVESVRITEMQEEIDGLKRERAEKMVDELLESKVQLVQARGILKRVILSEMINTETEDIQNLVTNVLQSNETTNLISEIVGNKEEKRITPVSDVRNKSEDHRSYTVKS